MNDSSRNQRSHVTNTPKATPTKVVVAPTNMVALSDRSNRSLMIDISKIDNQTLELMKEISKSDIEYVVPLVSLDDSIFAYDVIEGSEGSVCAIAPSLIHGMIAQFHNHPDEIKVLITGQDISILHEFNIPLIIGGKKEIKLFELKSDNTIKDDLEHLTHIQDRVLEDLSLGRPIDEELRNKFRNAYEKALSNLNITFIHIE